MGKKWQEIKHADVEVGDWVKAVLQTGELTTILIGPVVSKNDEHGCWEIERADSFYATDFQGSDSKLFRKKIPFELPKKLGAVFVGRSVNGGKNDATFIRTGGQTWCEYFHKEGNVFYSEQEVQKFFDNFGPYKEESE